MSVYRLVCGVLWRKRSLSTTLSTQLLIVGKIGTGFWCQRAASSGDSAGAWKCVKLRSSASRKAERAGNDPTGFRKRFNGLSFRRKARNCKVFHPCGQLRTFLVVRVAWRRFQHKNSTVPSTFCRGWRHRSQSERERWRRWQRSEARRCYRHTCCVLQSVQFQPSGRKQHRRSAPEMQRPSCPRGRPHPGRV